MKILSAIIYLAFSLSLSLSVQAEVLHCNGGGFGILPIEAVGLECKGQNSGKMYDALLGGVIVGMGVKFERLIISCPGVEGDALLGIYVAGVVKSL